MLGQLLRLFGTAPAKPVGGVVFFADQPEYWPYLTPFAERLLDTHGRMIHLLTCDSDDPLLADPPAGMTIENIGKGMGRTMRLTALEAEVFVATTPELGRPDFPRSRGVGAYVYAQHNLNRIHMVFPPKAFDAYDAFLAAGPHHRREIEIAAARSGCRLRHAPVVGYPKIDAAAARAAQGTGEPDLVLIAPTWSPGNLLEAAGMDLVGGLLAAGFRVLFRPHRDLVAARPAYVTAIIDRFGEQPGFLPDPGPGKGLADDASLLITDWSGAAFSFAFGLCRPVLSIDVPPKVLNPNYVSFGSEPLEIAIRASLGAVLDPAKIADAPAICRRLIADSINGETAPRLTALRSEHLYGFGNAVTAGAAFIDGLAAGTAQD